MVVVGGGPAGTATAIWCAGHGVRVVLLERSAQPLERPGESLHPGAETVLAQLGVAGRVAEAGFVRHAGHWLLWGDDPVFVPFGGDGEGLWRGFQARRAVLDTILLRRAEELGVMVRRPSGRTEAVVEEGRVVGVDTPDGRLRSRVVVDASGGRHWLARQLRLPVHRASPRLVARYGYRAGFCGPRHDSPMMAAEPRGWSWSARVGERLYAWARLSWGRALPADAEPPEELRALRACGRVRGADVTWRAVSECAGPGYFLVGDAAAVVDPASSHGVLKALMSGMHAGHLIVAAGHDRRRQDVAAEQYRTWLRRWFDHDCAALRDLYRRLPGHRQGW